MGLIFLLAACGGGGGGSDTAAPAPSPVPAPAPAPAPTPGNVDSIAFAPIKSRGIEGDKLYMALHAVAANNITSNFSVKLEIPPEISPYASADFGYIFGMGKVITLPNNTRAGKYQGFIKVSLCLDNPSSCSKQHPGSPWYVPFDVEIIAASSNALALAPLPGAPAWAQRGGNSTSSNSISLDAFLNPTDFKIRWRAENYGARQFITSKYGDDRVLASNGNVFILSKAITLPQSNWSTYQILALRESDGKLAWKNLAIPEDTNNSKINQDRIVSQTTQAYVVRHTDTGATENLPLPEGSVNDVFPSGFVSTESNLYSADTSSIYGYNLATNKILWKQAYKTQSNVPPAPRLADNRHLLSYSQAGGMMLVHRISDGTFVKELQAKNGRTKVDGYSSAMIVNGQLLWLDINDDPGQNRTDIYSISINNPEQQWKIRSGNIYSNLAGGRNEIYYVGNYSTLTAVSASDGSTLWSTRIPENLDYSHGFPGQAFQILVVGNMLFVSSQTDDVKQTYAIDRSTGKIVWSLPTNGAMAVTQNGTLIISRSPRAFELSDEPWEHAVFAVSLR